MRLLKYPHVPCYKTIILTQHTQNAFTEPEFYLNILSETCVPSRACVVLILPGYLSVLYTKSRNSLQGIICFINAEECFTFHIRKYTCLLMYNSSTENTSFNSCHLKPIEMTQKTHSSANITYYTSLSL